MKLNEAVISHYRAEMVPTSKLKKVVALNENYLKEKPTWYEIEGKLQYFKIRNDFRLFTEQFYSIFAKQVLGLDTLDYKVSYVRTIVPGENPQKEVTKCGLLSENFQDPKYNYYLVSELMNPDISHLKSFGDYSLKSILEFFKTILQVKDYNEAELFFIRLFIGDGLTHQVDRNFHNICFKIPKVNGISYKQRLFTSTYKGKFDNKNLVAHEDGFTKIKNFTPSKVYDNERIFGADHKNVFTYKKGEMWCPLFPYSSETFFDSQEKAQKASQDDYFGLDPNLTELYINHESICKPIFERIALDDEYRKILEQFKNKNSQIILSEEDEKRVTKVFEDKRETFKRILSL